MSYVTWASHIHTPATAVMAWQMANSKNICMESVGEGNKAVLVFQYSLFNGAVFDLS